MFSIKIALESDLSSIIDIYSYSKHLSETETCFDKTYPIRQQKLTYTNKNQFINYFKEYIKNKDNGIYLMCFNDTIIGFSTFESDPLIPDCLFISNFYFDFSKIFYINELSEKNIDSIKTEMLLFLMNKASEKGYHNLSIISDNYNCIHKICMSYNAESINFCGLMYSYSEKMLFKNIKNVSRETFFN